MLRISDLVTNASQENKGAIENNTTTNMTKRSITDQLAQHASGCSNVTSADIRQIKLNYLQLNKRSTVSNTNVALTNAKKEAYGGLANNEYTNVEDERNNDTAMEQLPTGHHKTPSSQARIGGPNIQLDANMPLQAYKTQVPARINEILQGEKGRD